MKRILFVLKDIMAAKMVIPVIKQLKTREGVELILHTEGQATEICKNADLCPQELANDRADKNQVISLILVTNPKVVCVGTSTPSNWERVFAKTAKELGIPLIIFEDIWGALPRLNGVIPELALTIDEQSAKMIVEQNLAQEVRVIGDVASIVDTGVTESTKEAEVSFQENTVDKTSIMIVPDHPDNVLEVTKLIADSIQLEANPRQIVCYYSLWHPKYADADKFPQYAHVLPGFAQLTEGLTFIHRGQLSTDSLARMCDITVGGFTTPLRIALHHGKRAISIWGPITERLHQEECGFRHYPLTEMGVVPSLSERMKLSSLDWPRFDLEARRWTEATKYLVEIGVEAILEIVES